jgi:hypothetical protein
MSVDTMFSRLFLAETHKVVKAHFPQINLKDKKYWVYHFGGDHWEFHGPDKFYWHGSAGNAYDARANGWQSWLRSKGIEDEGEV